MQWLILEKPGKTSFLRWSWDRCCETNVLSEYFTLYYHKGTLNNCVTTGVNGNSRTVIKSPGSILNGQLHSICGCLKSNLDLFYPTLFFWRLNVLQDRRLAFKTGMWSSRSVPISEVDSGRSQDVPIDEAINAGSSGNFEQVLTLIIVQLSVIKIRWTDWHFKKNLTFRQLWRWSIIFTQEIYDKWTYDMQSHLKRIRLILNDFNSLSFFLIKFIIDSPIR